MHKVMTEMWDVRKWETEGVLRTRGERGKVPDAESNNLQHFYPEGEYGNPQVYIGRDVFPAREDAVVEAGKRRKVKMEELRKCLRELECMIFLKGEGQ